MSHLCTLETDGYRVLFNIRGFEADHDYLTWNVEFQLDPQLGHVLLKSIHNSIAVKDLLRLVEYLEQHITKLREDPCSTSDVFVEWELGFEAQAFSGDIISEREGAFNLVFMVNVGKALEDDTNTYIGGDSVITVENIQRFASEVRGTLADLGSI